MNYTHFLKAPKTSGGEDKSKVHFGQNDKPQAINYNMKKHLGNDIELPTSTKPCRPLMAKTNPKWTLARMGRTMNRALLMRIMVPHTLPTDEQVN